MLSDMKLQLDKSKHKEAKLEYNADNERRKMANERRKMAYELLTS